MFLFNDPLLAKQSPTLSLSLSFRECPFVSKEMKATYSTQSKAIEKTTVLPHVPGNCPMTRVLCPTMGEKSGDTQGIPRVGHWQL